MLSPASKAGEAFHVKVVGALSGHELSIQCTGDPTIKDVKVEVDQLWDIPVRAQKLAVADSVPADDLQLCSFGASGEVVLSLIREEITGFREGDRVIAVRDSAYCPWRKAGDQGEVVEVDFDGGVVVFWDEHEASTPFGPDIPGANPWEILRIVRSPTRTLQVGDLVVATKSGVDGALSYCAGSEGTIQSIDDMVGVVVSWKGPMNTITNFKPSHATSNVGLVAVCPALQDKCEADYSGYAFVGGNADVASHDYTALLFLKSQDHELESAEESDTEEEWWDSLQMSD